MVARWGGVRRVDDKGKRTDGYRRALAKLSRRGRGRHGTSVGNTVVTVCGGKRAPDSVRRSPTAPQGKGDCPLAVGLPGPQEARELPTGLRAPQLAGR